MLPTYILHTLASLPLSPVSPLICPALIFLYYEAQFLNELMVMDRQKVDQVTLVLGSAMRCSII